MPPGLQRRGGRGSNQYQTKPGSAAVDPAKAADLRAAVEIEEVAWTFVPEAKHAGWDAAQAARKAPPADIVKLAAHPDPQVRAGLAQSPRCPIEVLVLLADTDDTTVLQAVVSNPRCPTEIVNNLVDVGPYNALLNPNCSRYVFDRVLAQHPSQWKAMALHPNCPPDILRSMIERVEADGHCTHDLDPSFVIVPAVRNWNCPADIVNRLAHDDNENIRAAAAYHPDIDPRELERLSREKNQVVWNGVARNPNTPAPILEHLAVHGNNIVRDAVAGHPNTPLVLLDTLTRDSSKKVQKRATVVLESRRSARS